MVFPASVGRWFLPALLAVSLPSSESASTPLRVSAPSVIDWQADQAITPFRVKRPIDEFRADRDAEVFRHKRWSVLSANFPLGGAVTSALLGPLRMSCVLLTILLQLSPLRPVLEIRSKGDVLRYDGFPFFIVLAGSIQWCIYGVAATVLTRDWTHFTLVESYGLGVIFGIFYVTVYCRYVHVGDARWESMTRYITAGVFVLVIEISSLAMFGGKAVGWLGLLGAVLGTALGVAPFKTLPEVLRTRSIAAWPTDLIIVCFIQSAVSGYFGFCIHDWWILVPNIVGVIAAGVQLAVIAVIQQPPKQVHGLPPVDVSAPVTVL